MDGTHPTYKAKRRLSTPSDDGMPSTSRKRLRSVAPDEDAMNELGSDPAHPIQIDEESEIVTVAAGVPQRILLDSLALYK